MKELNFEDAIPLIAQQTPFMGLTVEWLCKVQALCLEHKVGIELGTWEPIACVWDDVGERVWEVDRESGKLTVPFLYFGALLGWFTNTRVLVQYLMNLPMNAEFLNDPSGIIIQDGSLNQHEALGIKLDNRAVDISTFPKGVYKKGEIAAAKKHTKDVVQIVEVKNLYELTHDEIDWAVTQSARKWLGYSPYTSVMQIIACAAADKGYAVTLYDKGDKPLIMGFFPLSAMVPPRESTLGSAHGPVFEYHFHYGAVATDFQRSVPYIGSRLLLEMIEFLQVGHPATILDLNSFDSIGSDENPVHHYKKKFTNMPYPYYVFGVNDGSFDIKPPCWDLKAQKWVTAQS